MQWKCCRCQPLVLKEGEEKRQRGLRKCYNGNCACFRNKTPDTITGLHIACFNCDCGEDCYLTPEEIRKRSERDQEDKKKKTLSPKTDKILEKSQTQTKRARKPRNKLCLDSDDDDDDDRHKRQKLTSPEIRSFLRLCLPFFVCELSVFYFFDVQVTFISIG